MMRTESLIGRRSKMQKESYNNYDNINVRIWKEDGGWKFWRLDSATNKYYFNDIAGPITDVFLGYGEDND